MPKFKFQFESLLRLRESRRDADRQAVAEANQAIQILETRIEQKQQEIDDVKNLVADRLSGQLSVDDLLTHGRYEVQLTQEKAELEQQLAQVEVELNKRRETLTESDVEVRRIEKLKDRARESHRVKEARIVQNQLDEIGASVFRATAEGENR